MNSTKKQFKDFEWIDMLNPTEAEIEELNLPFKIDSKFIEDTLELGHLPKIEETDDYTFIILRAYDNTYQDGSVDVEEISKKIAFFIHPKVLLTVHRVDFPFLEDEKGNFDSSEALALSIFNKVLLTYFEPMNEQSDRIDQVEQKMFTQQDSKISIEKLYYEKSGARIVKKILVITEVVIDKFDVSENLATTLEDLKDTLTHLILQSEENIEDTNSIFNSYMSLTSQKSNNVMELLTVYSAFFLPISFLAGLFGMNFDNMPELHWEYGYPACLLLMLMIVLFTYNYFKKKKIL